jgi:hypothetical protein
MSALTDAQATARLRATVTGYVGTLPVTADCPVCGIEYRLVGAPAGRVLAQHGTPANRCPGSGLLTGGTGRQVAVHCSPDQAGDLAPTVAAVDRSVLVPDPGLRPGVVLVTYPEEFDR